MILIEFWLTAQVGEGIRIVDFFTKHEAEHSYFVPKLEKYDNFPPFTPKQLGLNSE